MKDLEFKINGRSLELFPGTTIRLELNSPLFDTELMKGSYSFPFSLPTTPVNQEMLGFSENPQSTVNRSSSYVMDIYYEKKFFMQGTMEVVNPGSTRYSCNFLAPTGGITDTQNEQLLTTLDLGSVSIPTTLVYADLFYCEIPSFLPTPGVAISHYILLKNNVVIYDLGYGFFGDAVETATELLIRFCSEVNAAGLEITLDSEGLLLMVTPDLNTADSYTFRYTRTNKDRLHYTRTTNVPMILLTYQSISPFPDATSTNTDEVGHFVFPTIYNPSFYPADQNKLFSKYVNFYEAGQYGRNSAKVRNQHTLVPMLFLTFAIKKIMLALGYTVEGGFLADANIRKLVLYNTHAIDKQVEGITAIFNIFDPVIKYANHLPTVTVQEFLTSLRNFACLTYDFNQRTKVCKIRYMRDILNGRCKIDWTDKVAPEWEITSNQAEGVTLKFALDSGDDKVKEPAPAIFENYGTGKEEIPIGISTLVTETIEGNKVPSALQPGISPFYGLKDNQSTARLLFWKGLQPGGDGENYPQADNEYNGFKLRLTGTGGIVERYWREYLAWRLGTFAIEMPINLDVEDLANFDWSQKRYIRGVNYFPTRILVTLPLTKPAQVTLQKA